jgi:type I pantothenate kinase
VTAAHPSDRPPPEDGFDTLWPEQLASLVGPSDERWSDRDLVRSVSEGMPVDEDQVTGVFVPLAQLIAERLPLGCVGVTSLVGITGSVASGKSTITGILADVLRRTAPFPSVDLLGTDAFLYPNHVLEERGLLGRKGFPETFDHRTLIDAVAAVRSGQAVVEVPVYDHRAYDVLPGAVQRIRRPDVLLVEGLTVLQRHPVDELPPDDPASSDPASVRPDMAIYIDAAEQDVAAWHRQRLMALRDDRGGTPTDFSRWFASLSDQQADQVAESSWSEINLVNLRRYVAPTRGEADVILVKGSDHRISQVMLRRR